VSYQELEERLSNGEVLVLDGAIGTEITRLGAPAHPIAWSAEALFTHPHTVRKMHERYIKAGADIITTNTFSSNRDVLEASGYGYQVREANIRAVYLAREAIERAAGGRPVYLAGAISGRHVGRDPITGTLKARSGDGYNLDPAVKSAYYEEMVDHLADEGVDFFLLENLMDQPARELCLKAAKSSGLPVWSGFSMVNVQEGVITMADNGREDLTLAQGIDEVMTVGGMSGMVLMHAEIPETTAGLGELLDKWPGPIGAYPDSPRPDWLAKWQDTTIENRESPKDFLNEARKWVDMGVQVIGTCCGFGVEYIEPLKEGLPTHIPNRRKVGPFSP
jgi:homocysteine S-methyltransferase